MWKPKIYKALAELCEKKGGFHMTNAELAEKLYSVLDACLDDGDKNIDRDDDLSKAQRHFSAAGNVSCWLG